MPIRALKATNFKGIAESQDFEIRPITLFIGPNSSGKSSCVHALGSMAQTLKLSSSANPLILDDEFAQIHLGRYVEVIHTRSYADSIALGISVQGVVAGSTKNRLVNEKEDVHVHYTFKSTKKTQEMYLNNALISAGKWKIEAKRKGNALEIINHTNGYRTTGFRTNGFLFSVTPAEKEPADPFFDTYSVVSAVHRTIGRELRNTLYLGPFRQPPLRRYPSRGSSPVEVGALGEATVNLLANEFLRSSRRPHLKQVSTWLSVMGLAKTLNLSRLGSSDLFDVNVTLKDDVTLPIADLGYGVSQALPVLVQCSFAPEGSTLLFEQPELHLHCGAARMLAKVFADIVNGKGVHIVAETHSPDLFWQIIDELRQKNLKLDQVRAYKVKREKGKSIFESIEIVQENGNIDVYDPWKGDLDKP